MTIQEVKDEKAILKMKIEEAINDFQKNTEVSIIDITIYLEVSMMRKSKVVKTDIKLDI